MHRFEYLFNFDSMFEIHDDIEVLKRMGMACGLEVGKCSPDDLKVARSLVPKALEPYVIGERPDLFICHGYVSDVVDQVQKNGLFSLFPQRWRRVRSATSTSLEVPPPTEPVTLPGETSDCLSLLPPPLAPVAELSLTVSPQ